MIELEVSVTDDPAFAALAGRLVAAAAESGGHGRVVAVHIGHWFGPRWLGFCGKILGAAGVRMARLDGHPPPPPFHPHRVLSAREYRRNAAGVFEPHEEVGWLHGPRPSEQNVNRGVRQNYLYAWYSGDTGETDRAVVMVYDIRRNAGHGNSIRYAAFHKPAGWHLTQTVGIAPHVVREYLGVSATTAGQNGPGRAP